MSEIEELREQITALSNWQMEQQEEIDALKAVVASLSSQDPTTPDPFTEIIGPAPTPEDPEPVKKKPSPVELMERVWSLDVGGKMEFLEGHIEMIRKPGTFPILNYRGMQISDPGEIKVVHPDFVNGEQHLSIRAAWSAIADTYPEIDVWFRKETGVIDWGKNYYEWQKTREHRRTAMYNGDTGLTTLHGGLECAEVKPYGRVDGAPKLPELMERWL